MRAGRDAIAGLALFAAVGWAVLSLPEEAGGLTELSLRRLPESGVTNPVTAVLLNYRGYDTLLEIGVLLLALAAAWSLAPSTAGAGPPPSRDGKAPHPAVRTMVRLLAPVIVIGAGYFLWIGSYAPGGAFQGGAILGGALVLMLLAGARAARRVCGSRVLIGLGLAVFLAIAVLPMLTGGSLLQYPEGSAKGYILAIEAAATISIGLTLAALFLGTAPAVRRGESGRGETK